MRKNYYVMRKTVFRIISIIMVVLLSSCEIDNGDSSGQDYRAKLAGTHWQVTAIRNHNNDWQTPYNYPVLLFSDILFGTDNRYEMINEEHVTISYGTYHYNNGAIEFAEQYRQGIAYSIKVSLLDDTAFEGNFTIWGDDLYTYEPDGNGVTITQYNRGYTIRMERVR